MFTAVVNAVTDHDSGEIGQVSSTQFETLAEAEKHVAVEMHGLEQAFYQIRANLPLKKATALVAASRNRTIHLALTAPGASITPYMELKAPMTIKCMETIFGDKEADEVLVPVRITARAGAKCGHLYVC